MGAQVISLFQRPSPIRDWTQQELAEFYRVENALLQAGMQIETDRGVTDDGEPWFAFCRADDGEVFIHFARIGGKYIIAGSAYGGVIEGWDFASLVRELIARHPLVQMGPARKPSNIFMHPAALLIAVVGTAFFKTGEAKADDGSDRHEGRRLMLATSGTNTANVSGPSAQVALDAHQTMTLVAAAMAAAASYEVAAAQTGMPTWRLMSDTLCHAASPAALTGALTQAAPLPTAGSGGLAVAALPTQDSGDWLSLAAVLSEVASPEDIAMSPAPTGGTAQIWIDETQAALAPAGVEVAQAPMQAAPLMLVELAAGPLPDVAAVRLVRDLGAFDKAPVVRVAELPQFIADWIANGRQIQVSDDAAAAPPPAATPEAPAPVSEAPATPDGAPPPIMIDNPTVDVTPLVPPAPVGPTPEKMTEAQVTELIGMFVNSTPFAILSSGDDLVFYDTRIPDIFAYDGSVYTRVLTFGDGSTVTLIGMAHEDYAFLLPGGG